MFRGLFTLIFLALLAFVAFLEIEVNGLRFGHIHLGPVNFWLVDVAGYKPQLANANSRFAAEQSAFRGEQALVNTLSAQITAQNASIDALHRASDTRAKAAQAALAVATGHGERLDALAGQIRDSAPRGAAVADCRTPDDVMNARSAL